MKIEKLLLELYAEEHIGHLKWIVPAFGVLPVFCETISFPDKE